MLETLYHVAIVSAIATVASGLVAVCVFVPTYYFIKAVSYTVNK